MYEHRVRATQAGCSSVGLGVIGFCLFVLAIVRLLLKQSMFVMFCTEMALQYVRYLGGSSVYIKKIQHISHIMFPSKLFSLNYHTTPV